MQQGGLVGMLLPLAVFVVIFYFLIVRPQKKRQRQHEEMLASIRKGDVVITAGGFWGTVREIKDDSFIIEIADGVKVRILKSSIQMKRSAVDAEASPKPKKSEKAVEEKPVEEETKKEN
ncbi:preprotein translocase, YajC subunit [Thermovirga lienii DSM 17291]|uniref:Preprotein translocase, YajC subunit n=1 Tax=Thermovirga lienii (strain ATCC BAA-1197 / DSM 17291 / Cas60314) TaxID=580340 RepID=G7V8Q5_THELD|nr:preprotein translocase, YajC subunit [Thermovirga lienii DSM 17291]